MSDEDLPYTPARPPRSAWRGALLLALVAFAIGIAVTAIAMQYYRQWLPGSAQPLAAGQAAPSGEAPGTAFVPPPEAGSAARAIDSETLGARQTALAAELASLEARATTIDREARGAASNAGRAEGLLIAFAARRAIDRGLGLGYLEGQLRNRFGATQPGAVSAILRAAREPVTIEDLRLGLDTMAPELATGATTDGWWASLRREASTLIVIHRDGTPSPRPADRLARIRRLLDARQVEAAMAEVARLPGASQARRWSAAAARYVDAHRALDMIEAVAIMGGGTIG